MDTALSRPPAGQLLDGRYRVEAWLAHGGMATVYLGTDTRLDRKVALKIAHPDLAGDEEFIRRFMAEARSVARLSSPHVVAIYDQGTDGQFLYLAMEYVPGRTLRELLRERGRLSPREALDIIQGVLAGLAAAHEAGIVHRDVKPENVLLTNGDLVKVADFGLARAAAAASRTKSGMIIGTAAYLAPEQVSKSSSDARTDVYAAGIMLFELLTGTQPHSGGSPLDVAYKHVNDVVPAPSSLVPGLPPALDTLVALATSRDPDRRPADAGQFLRAISEVRRGLPITAPQPRGQHAAPYRGYPDQPAPGATAGHRAASVPPGTTLPGASAPSSGALAPASALPLGSLPPGPAGSLPPGPAGSLPPGPVSAAGGTRADIDPLTAASWPDTSSGYPGDRTAAPSWPDASSGYRGDRTAAPSWPDASPDSPRGGLAALPWTEAEAGPANGDLAPPGAGPAGHQPGHPGLTIPPGGTPVLPPPWPGTGPGGPASSDAWPGGEHGALAAAYPWPGEPHGPGGPGRLVPPGTQGPAGFGDGTNHTLIVSPGSVIDNEAVSPDRYRSRRARGSRRPGEPMLQHLLFSRRFIYLAGALAVVLVIALATWWLTAGQYATVPQVRGMPASVARTELTNLGFVVKSAPSQHSTSIATGEVIQTKPAMGTRPKQGSVVQLIVSLGPLKFPVPQVTGMPLDAAQAALRKAGLTPGSVTQTTSTTIPTNIVISTNPVQGVSWPQNVPVAITISAGLPLQNLVGQQLPAAQATAQQAGYALNPVPDAKSNQPAGTITSQSPAPGTPISPNEVVTVHVANGPPMVDIPDVQGMNVDEATQQLTSAGFNVTVNQVIPGHKVINYSPTGQAPKGTIITLNVGFFSLP
jgi:beta-lactam-binding protein with PASTA domain/serine/threonine protein kinase